ncbi:MAG: ABC transporter permease [Oscillospiraceae bacterium]|nr:ABC transporter permease [Oscillospiraceae bacterium]
MSAKLKRFASNNKTLLIMLGVIAVVFIILSLTVPNFATPRNLTNLLQQIAPIAVMACGATYVLVIGGMDISNPAVMAASAVVGVYYMTTLGGNLIVGTFVIILTASLLGLINGFAIAKLKMVPMVVTLSMMTIGTGLATILSGTRGLPILPPSFSTFFNKTTVIIILLLVTIVLDFILTGTKFGRKLYYIGNNARTARVSGIDSENLTMLTYVISGLCAGIAGVINTASIATARANMGPQSQILDIISAAVIGGVSPNGGTGRVRDAVLGAFLIVGLNNVMNLLAVSDYYTTLIKGGIIIGAMGISSYRQQQALKKGA